MKTPNNCSLSKLLSIVNKTINCFVIIIIHAYRLTLSPMKKLLFGPHAACRFHPTCSRYALDCFRRHPFPKAVYLTCKRLLRCQPFCKGGYDPAP